MIQDLPIIDAHCHFPVKGKWFPDYNLPERVAFDTEGSRNHGEIWRKAYNFPKQDAPEDDKIMAGKWHNDMISKGVEKAVFVSGGGNDRLAEIVKMYPDQFLAYAHHHPDAEDAAEQLEHAFRDLGFKGYKMLGPLIDTPLSDKKYYPLWEICEAYHVPVLIHFGLLGAAGGKPDGVNISPLSIAQAALDFPKLNFIVPHFGCTHMGDLLNLAWTRPNVYIDSSGSNQWVRWMPYQLSLEDVVRKFVETVGPGRLIFATDSSWMPRGFASIYLEEQNKLFRFMGLNDDEMYQVFYGNAARLLRLS
ncbi:MAG: amidohydrolase family protein [Spirochaetia bacterium]|nr:amidohydrolase family protein [Spirochaetia bacterium]MCF7946793.1 amidohydrolase family protein [Spirochaetia bacterium]MCF7952689.1 amidohydrolase family protein [Spirochaetales bacterium]